MYLPRLRRAFAKWALENVYCLTRDEAEDSQEVAGRCNRTSVCAGVHRNAAVLHGIPDVAYNHPSDLLPGREAYSRVSPADLDPSDCWEQLPYPFAVAQYAEKNLRLWSRG